MPEKEIPSDTAQERDERQIAEVRARIGQHARIRLGLPQEPSVTEAEFIPPRSMAAAIENPFGPEANSYLNSEKVIPIHVHIRFVRDELIVAQRTDDAEAYREIKKRAA